MQKAKIEDEFGEYFVPKDHKNRLVGYTQLEQIFLGDHIAAFNPNLPDGAMYIPELFGQLISFTSADLLFGLEPVSITSTDEVGTEFVDTFREANRDFDTRLFEAALSNSYFGDIVVELKLVDDKPEVIFHDPRNWVFKLNPDGTFRQHELCFMVKDVSGELYLHKRIHQKGLIINELWKVTNRDKTKKTFDEGNLTRATFADIGMDVQDEEPTGVDDFLVKQIPNMRLLNGVAGLSDYVGKKQLMNALNMLTSFATYVLEKNSDPAMEVPEGTLNADSEVYREDFRVFQTNAQTKGIPRYITWDGGLTSLFEQRTHVIEMLALYSEISLGLLGKETGGPMPEAYRTARLKYMRTLMKMARKQRYWTEGLLWVMETSQKLTGVKDSSVSDFNIQFSDGLPNDTVEELEGRMLERDLKIKSNETIVRETLSQQGWTQEQIEDELEKIRLEKSANTPPNMSTAPVNIFERSTEVTQPEDGEQGQAGNSGS